MEDLFERTILIVEECRKLKDNYAAVIMRFLLRTEELNNLAMIKRLITCSTVYSFDDVYAPLGSTKHLYQLELGILDNTYIQLRKAAYQVLLGNKSVDEAVAGYGKY